jgi:hypothetical protein
MPPLFSFQLGAPTGVENKNKNRHSVTIINGWKKMMGKQQQKKTCSRNAVKNPTTSFNYFVKQNRQQVASVNINVLSEFFSLNLLL